MGFKSEGEDSESYESYPVNLALGSDGRVQILTNLALISMEN